LDAAFRKPGKTAAGAARASGINETTLSRWRRQESVRTNNTDGLAAVAAYLGVSVDEIAVVAPGTIHERKRNGRDTLREERQLQADIAAMVNEWWRITDEQRRAFWETYNRLRALQRR
jgi:transposase-like protein